MTYFKESHFHFQLRNLFNGICLYSQHAFINGYAFIQIIYRNPHMV